MRPRVRDPRFGGASRCRRGLAAWSSFFFMPLPWFGVAASSGVPPLLVPRQRQGRRDQSLPLRRTGLMLRWCGDRREVRPPNTSLLTRLTAILDGSRDRRGRPEGGGGGAAEKPPSGYPLALSLALSRDSGRGLSPEHWRERLIFNCELTPFTSGRQIASNNDLRSKR